MKRILIALCLLPLLAIGAHAKDIKIPSDKPVISVTLPPGWTSEDMDNGISCQDKEKTATIFFEVVAEKEMDALIEENIKYLIDNKVNIDRASKTVREAEGAGIKFQILDYKGKDEYGDEHIQMYFGEVKPGKMLMITSWVTTKSEADHLDEFVKLLNSLKKL